eukprot:TRINITY_DN57088_c0_g1_i1.p1 TRINITY_DN57088_c0_g1~~TRINITY_DN57088_c0_g1_i1.p1  ORF type:complete len:319 (+),score=37.62 TRINITY_DN57088_c0_g1_i1:64-1020(+)
MNYPIDGQGIRIHAPTEKILKGLCQQFTKAAIAIGSVAVGDATTKDIQDLKAHCKYEAQYQILLCYQVRSSSQAIKEAKESDVDIVTIQGIDDPVAPMRAAVAKRKATSLKKQWINWHPVGKGRITVWHRPPPHHIQRFAEEGATAIVTLQSEREQVHEVQKLCKKHNLTWIWYDLPGAAVVKMKKEGKVFMGHVQNVLGIVREGGSAVIHCAAGVHRTGTFLYTVLRTHGLSPEEAKAAMWEIRPATARGVGQQRLDLAENFVLENYFTSRRKSLEPPVLKQTSQDETQTQETTTLQDSTSTATTLPVHTPPTTTVD